MDWRELWRLMLAPGATPAPAPEPRATLDVPRPAETAEAADLGSDEGRAVERARFLFVVARTRMDMFLTIRRRFLDDRGVHVLLDRREQERRSQSNPVAFPDRRGRVDRRRPVDYWEDPAHHAAVLIPLFPGRPGTNDLDSRPSTDRSARDKEPTMERVMSDEARVLAWVQEGQHVLQHVLPAVLDERDDLKSRLHEASRRCQELDDENNRLRADLARATTAHLELEHGHADIVASLGEFLTQMTHVMEPMRALAEKVAQASQRRDGIDRPR